MFHLEWMSYIIWNELCDLDVTHSFQMTYLIHSKWHMSFGMNEIFHLEWMSCVTRNEWVVECMRERWDEWVIHVERMRCVPDPGWFIRMNHLNESFEWIIRMNHSNESFEWFIRMIHSDDSFEWMKEMCHVSKMNEFCHTSHVTCQECMSFVTY